MPFEKNLEKSYTQTPDKVFAAGQKAVENLQGKISKSDSANFKFEAKLPKTILGKTLGDRTFLAVEVRPKDGGSLLVLEAYPLDAVERKLMFGARKGVVDTVVTWFVAHTDHEVAK